MKARLKNLVMSLDGGQELTLSFPGDWRQEYESLKDRDVFVEIKKWHDKRSPSANALLWALCREVGNAMRLSDVEIYRRAVRESGQYEHLPIKAVAVDTFARRWESRGIGWFVDVLDDSKLPGYKLVKVYYGSSSYDSAELSRLIDYVMDDAKQIGITPRASEKQIQEALARWGDA